MEQSFLKKSLPHIIAVLTFLVISFVYFSPVFDGKELVGHDTESYIGMSKEIKDYNANNDDAAIWTGRMFSGMPAYQIHFEQPDNITVYFNNILSIFPRVVYTLFLYLIGFYILLLSFKVNPWLSIACAIGFAFGSYNFIILTVGHNTKAMAIAYMAPLIGSVVMAFRWKPFLGAALTALFLGLAINANHLQILYYTLYTLVIFGVVELIYAIKENRLPKMLASLGLLLVGAGIALGTNITQLLTTQEYSEYTMRGKSNGLTIDKDSKQEGLSNDYITQWSYGIDETMTLLIPNFKGGSSQEKLSSSSNTAAKLREMGAPNVDEIMNTTPMPTYWGTQPGTSGPVYVGAIICFLFALGLILVEGKNKWWILGATLLAILLAWGKNFMPFTDFFINYVPFYNMFRAVSMTLVIAAFCIALMAALALKEIFSTEIAKEKKIKALYIASGVVGGICLLFALIPSFAGDFKNASDAALTSYGFPEFILNTLPQDRADMLRSDAFRSLVFILLSAVLLWLYVSKNLKAHFVYIGLGLLFLFDMVPVAKRYLNKEHFKEKHLGAYFEATTADKLVLNDKSQYRVLDISVDIFNSSKPSYFHNTIGGYHAAKLRRYQELINNHLSREISNIGASFQSAQKAQSMEPILATLSQNQILNMLNMKYLIYNPEGEPIKNQFANGNAWFVSTCHIAQTADEEMLKLGTLNTKTELVADKAFAAMLPKQIGVDSTATIVQTSYSPNVIKYESNAKTDQVAVFSEIYYDKGWNAYVDGQEQAYFRANYLLRAMPIKAGKHQIEFRFEPASYYVGNTIALVSSILLVLVLAGAISLEVRNKKKKTEA